MPAFACGGEDGHTTERGVEQIEAAVRAQLHVSVGGVADGEVAVGGARSGIRAAGCESDEHVTVTCGIACEHVSVVGSVGRYGGDIAAGGVLRHERTAVRR